MQFFNFFPNHIVNIIKEYSSNLEEIRIRIGLPIILKYSNKSIVLEYKTTQSDLLDILEKICENSIYSYQNQICNGYITIIGGHRVGITGSVVMQNGKIVNINNISSLNFRIARQVLGCSNELLKYIIDYENNTIYNTLVVSPPGSGKTTILRDTIRQISNGIGDFEGKTIGIVDERNEISAMYKGISQNDIGIRTDVLENIPKSIGMKMLVRSMAPQIICADEIGSLEDVEAIKYIVCSGVKGIFTAHGANMQELQLNPELKKLLDSYTFKRIVFLDESNRGKLKEVYELKDKEYIIMKVQHFVWYIANVVGTAPSSFRLGIATFLAQIM